MNNDDDRMDMLLTAVRRAIWVHNNNFYIFLQVLDAWPQYQYLVRRMNTDVAQGMRV